MSKQNTTFMNADPTWANACVGHNGSPGAFEYAAGFAAAANLLIDTVIENEGIEYHVDEFIYPICFNMRHAIELFLKDIVEQLKELGTHRNNLPLFDAAASHDLNKIWKFIKCHALTLDKRYIDPIDELDEFILDIAEIDSSGQVFRYPYSNENNKHLIDIATINIFVLKQRFEALQTKLQRLHHLGQALLEEYSWSTYTTKLSREELLWIALVLPNKKDWTTDAFIKSRDHIRQRWELSSKDFQRAVCKIQENYEMSAMIGIQLPLQHVTERVLFEFFDHWGVLHDLERVRNPPEPSIANLTGEDFVDGIIRRHKIRESCWEKMAELISPEVLGELESLFYFHRDMYYSEAFVRIRERTSKALTASHRPDRSNLKGSLLHLLDKTNGLLNVLNSLNFLGQRDLLTSLIVRLDLQAVISRLLAQSTARSWVTQRIHGQAS